MDPYEILGVGRFASMDEIKEAYKNKSREYYAQNDEYSKMKLKQLDDAYDLIVNNIGGSNREAVYSEIRSHIDSGNLNEAERKLNGIPRDQRNAQWYYLSGCINRGKGYIENAYKDFTTAHNMEPGNSEYENAFNSMNTQRNTGYRTTNTSNNSGCSSCDICEALLCANCLCECCDCLR